jgi:hypothetical protein
VALCIQAIYDIFISVPLNVTYQLPVSAAWWHHGYLITAIFDIFISVPLNVSAASFCCQVAAWVPDMFCNFYFAKNYKIANNSTTADAKKTRILNP